MGPLAQAWWISAPVIVAGVAHMLVVRRGWFAGLARPLDGGRTLGGRPLLGPNKTWRGLLFMALAPLVLGGLQGAAWGPAAAAAGLEPIDLAGLGARLGAPGRAAPCAGYALLGLVLGVGYGLGELPNSFLKRRLAIEPGKARAGLVGGLFVLLDQADSVLAALSLALLLGLPWAVFLAGVVSLTGLHLLLNAALYAARLRRNL